VTGYSLLIAVRDLAAHLGDPAWRLFDCRHDLADPGFGERAYADGHLPGAQFVHLDRDLSGNKTGRNGRHPLPDRAAFAARLGVLGVARWDQVVVYDDAGGMFAARLWWMLRWLGHPSVALLDGGLQAWLSAGMALSRASARHTKTQYLPGHGAEPVDVGEVTVLLGKPDAVLVDARSPDRFRGENEMLDPVGGHIPGARNRFFRDNLGADLHFKPPDALRADFAAVVGSVDPATVIHQCGSGVTACHNLLAMQVAGLTGSRLYAGSWSEWCADPARPVARTGISSSAQESS
jgi:thiosulfate/3-mercaptopyruvate sulfurtransferase